METFLEDLEVIHAQVSQEAAVLLDIQNDLVDSYAGIESAKAVDREQGKVIIKHAPSLESLSPNMFTMFPTKTNYNVAVEGFWDGITTAIGKLFEAIFKLISGTLKLFIRPFTWLFGDDDKAGATKKARETVEKMKSSEVVDNADKEERKEVVDEVVKDTSLNMWEFLVLKNFVPGTFIELNEYIEHVYDTVLKSNTDFVSSFGKLKGGEAGHATAIDLLSITGTSSEKLTKASGKILGAFKGYGINVSGTTTTEAVDSGFDTVRNSIDENEAESPEEAIVAKHCLTKLNSWSKLMSELETGLDFEKSDEKLFKMIDVYTEKFSTMESKISKIAETELATIGLEVEDLMIVKQAIRHHLVVIQRANKYIGVSMKLSIKGKRAMFKSIALYKAMFTKFAANAK